MPSPSHPNTNPQHTSVRPAIAASLYFISGKEFGELFKRHLRATIPPALIYMGFCHDMLQALVQPADGSSATSAAKMAAPAADVANAADGAGSEKVDENEETKTKQKSKKKNRKITVAELESKRSRAGIVIKFTKERMLKRGVIKHLIAVAQRFADPQMQFTQRCE